MKKLIYKLKYKIFISIFSEYTIFASQKTMHEVTAMDLLDYLSSKIN